MQGTAILFPIALYRGPSGHSSAGLPRYGTFVWSSGMPCRRSHSNGVSLRTTYPPASGWNSVWSLPVANVPLTPSCTNAPLPPRHSQHACGRRRQLPLALSCLPCGQARNQCRSRSRQSALSSRLWLAASPSRGLACCRRHKLACFELPPPRAVFEGYWSFLQAITFPSFTYCVPTPL